MTRPKPDSQAGRILALLESRNGARVYLPEILALRIAQYSARIHDLRHKHGCCIQNGNDPGRPDHTWFRLVVDDPQTFRPIVPEVKTDPPMLFTERELRPSERWEDVG